MTTESKIRKGDKNMATITYRVTNHVLSNKFYVYIFGAASIIIMGVTGHYLVKKKYFKTKK
jgi:hypothetical protein